jgi:hypothetical protein
MQWATQLGCGSGLHDSESVLSLRYLMLGAELLSMGSHLLPLPKSVSSLKREAGIQPRCWRPR